MPRAAVAEAPGRAAVVTRGSVATGALAAGGGACLLFSPPLVLAVLATGLAAINGYSKAYSP